MDIEKIVSSLKLCGNEIVRDEIINKITESINNSLKGVVLDAIGDYTTQLYKLQDIEGNVHAEVEKTVRKILDLMSMIPKEFEFCTYEYGRLYISYDKMITANKVQRRNTVYNLEVDNFFINELVISISLAGIIGGAYASEAYHPNVDTERFNVCGTDMYEVCIGDLADTSITNVAKIPKMLETINMDSSYNNKASDEVDELLYEGDYVEKEHEVFDAGEVFE